MTDLSSAQLVRNLCDNIHDALALAEHPPAPRGGQSGACSYETDTKASTKETAFHVPLTCKETGKILTGENR